MDWRVSMCKAICAIVIGMGFLVAAGFSAQSTREFIRSSIVVPAQVVKLNAGAHHPQIDFVTKAGEHVSYPQGGMVSGMKVGDQVTVLYRPEAPSRTATLNRFGALWTWPIWLLTIGLGAIVAGLTNLPSRR
jgi:hypothetical protein